MKNWKGFGEKGCSIILRFYTDIRLDRQRKTTENLSQDSRSPGGDFNPAPPEYRVEVLTTQSRSSVKSLSQDSRCSDLDLNPDLLHTIVDCNSMTWKSVLYIPNTAGIGLLHYPAYEVWPLTSRRLCSVNLTTQHLFRQPSQKKVGEGLLVNVFAIFPSFPNRIQTESNIQSIGTPIALMLSNLISPFFPPFAKPSLSL
jgi:hypothetical protein